MPFTDLLTVRKHLVASNTPALPFENIPLTLSGTTPVPLPQGNVLASVSVKWLASELPTLEPAIVLVNENWASLSYANLARGSVVVASTLSLAQVFTEEHDYRVNHEEGRLKRLASGAIPNSFPAVVWYGRYHLFAESSDFVVDYAAGTVRRASGSTIPDGATVLVDYIVAHGSAEDLLIEQAIVEAEDVILRSLRQGYSASSTDQGLQSGATYLALHIVARGMAALMLTRNLGSDAYTRAREWLQLSDKWHTAAWNVLAPFVTPHSLRSTLVE